MADLFNRSKLKELREDRGLTQAQLAEALGIQQSRIAEAEGSGTLSVNRAQQLARFFDIDWKELLND